MYKYKSETWEISRIENNVIYYKSLNPLNSKKRQIKISENFFNKKNSPEILLAVAEKQKTFSDFGKM